MTLRRFFAPLLALACLLAPIAAQAQSIDNIARGLALRGVRPATTAACATVPTTQPCLDLTGTWATTGTYVGAIRLNVTDSGPANAASLLADFQVGAASKFSVNKAGTILSGAAGGATFQVNASDGLTRTFNTGGFAFTSSASADGTPDLILRRDAANTLAQRNGTSAQCFRLYNTFTDSSNGESGSLCWDGSNHFIIQTTAAGTGVLRETYLKGNQVFFGSGASGSNAWKLDTSGNFLAVTDNTFDIGASGATRPRNVFIAGAVNVGVNLVTSSSGVTTTPTTVSGLASCGTREGTHSAVTDANATFTAGIGAVVAGGGSNHVPVYCDGTNWRIGALSPANDNLIPDGLLRAFG